MASHCTKEYNAAYRANNRERINTASRVYYKKHGERLRVQRETLRRKRGVKPRLARLSDEELKARARARKKKQRGTEQYRKQRNAAAKLRYAENVAVREKHRVAAREWKKKNPDRYKANKRKRKKIKRARLIQKLWFLQKARCANCHTRLKHDKHLHLDHVIPLARGGSNENGNFQLLCAPCNLRKGATDPIEFMQSQGKLL